MGGQWMRGFVWLGAKKNELRVIVMSETRFWMGGGFGGAKSSGKARKREVGVAKIESLTVCINWLFCTNNERK